MAYFQQSYAASRLSALERSRFGLYDSAADAASLAHDHCTLVPPSASELPAFSVRLYRSGELSGAYFLSGCVSKVKPPPRSGPVVTTEFSSKARAKVRRAVENSSVDLVCFLTLTFSPWSCRPWEIQEYRSRVAGVSTLRSVSPCGFPRTSRRGRSFSLVPRVSLKRRAGFHVVKPLPNSEKTEVISTYYSVNVVVPIVRQDYAKHRLKNLRNALNMKVNRQIACKLKELPISDHELYNDSHKFRLVWVAELQHNGNIHFHAMTNKYFAKGYLAKVWPYGDTNVKKLRDASHAAHYMVKYISKEEQSAIAGNRYNISANLRKEAKPVIYGSEGAEAIAVRKLINLMKEMVEDRGGKVIDSGFGFNMPRPRRPVVYRDKDSGKLKKTRGCGKLPGERLNVHDAFLQSVFHPLEAYRQTGQIPF